MLDTRLMTNSSFTCPLVEVEDDSPDDVAHRYARKGATGVSVVSCKTLDFLDRLPDLRWLNVWLRLRDDAPAGRCSDLVRLDLPTGAKSAIDFAALPRLRQMEVNDRPSLDTLRGHSALEWLTLDGFKRADLSAVADLPRLESLDLKGAKQHLDLTAASSNPGLRALNLQRVGVDDLAVLTELPELRGVGFERVDTTSGRPVDLSPLLAVPHLQYLYLEHVSVSGLDALRERGIEIHAYRGVQEQDGSTRVPPATSGQPATSRRDTPSSGVPGGGSGGGPSEHADDSMDRDGFWQLIDACARTPLGRRRRPTAATATLTKALRKRSTAQVKAFEAHREEVHHAADEWLLWAAGYLIAGGMSDDSFDDFRSWLISQGRETYEAALADPDSLAALHLDQNDFYDAEDWGYAAIEVLEARDALNEEDDAEGSGNGAEAGTRGEPFPEDDDDWFRQHLPRLWAKHGTGDD